MCEAAGGDEQGAARGHTARIGLGMCQAARIPRQNAAWPAGAMKRRPRARSAGRAASELPADSPFVRGKVPSQHPRHNQGARRAGGAAWRAGRFKRPPKVAPTQGAGIRSGRRAGAGAGAAIEPAQGPTQGGPPCQKRAAPTPSETSPSRASRRGGGRHGHCHPCAACLDGQIAGGITAGGGAARSCPAEARLAANGGNGPRAARGRPACVGPRNI